jgi:hypothetical protein
MMSTITNFTVILDIDECLGISYVREGSDNFVNSLNNPENISHRNSYYSSDFSSSYKGVKFWGMKRPHLDKFLSFCFRYFAKVIVWSAGDYDYVMNMVEILFRDHRYPDAVLTKLNIEYVDKAKRDYHKPISKLINIVPFEIDLNKTIFIDDKDDNFRENIGNGIVIPCFNPESNKCIGTNDISFIEIINWLMTKEVRECEDVRVLDKNKIFKNSSLNIKTNIVNYEKYMTPMHKFFFSPITL